MPPTEEERGPDDGAERVVDDREVMVIGDDTPPQIDEFERLEVEGGGVGAALEETL